MTPIYHQKPTTDIHIRIPTKLREELVAAKINMSAVCRKALKLAILEHQRQLESDPQ